MIPHWAILGLSAAILSTAIPLIQERMKADGFAVAFWVKVAAVLLSAPFVVHFGFPDDPKFYGVLAITAVLWCISDVIYFRAVPVAGAGVISRLLPSAVIISFILWFFVDPGLLQKYVDKPAQSLAIITIILLATLFATRIRKCALSWQGVRLVWFVIFAACVGPIIEKLSLGYAPSRQAPYAFIFCQGLMMLGFWVLYYFVRKPIPARTLFSRQSVLTGAAIGSVATLVIYLKTTALVTVDQPAFLSVLLFTDALWILLVYRLLGRRDDSNIWAGLGIVGCAGALILVKSLF